MAQLNSLIVTNIAKTENDQYLISYRTEAQLSAAATVRVTLNQPVFGVFLPDELVLKLRDFPRASRKLTEMIRDCHRGLQPKLPIALLAAEVDAESLAA